MGCMSSRETKPSRDVSERSAEANRPRDLSYDALREMASSSARVGDSLDHSIAHHITLANEYLELAGQSNSKSVYKKAMWGQSCKRIA